MGFAQKVKNKLKYTEIAPLLYSEGLRSSYNSYSVTGGTLAGKSVLITGGTGGIGHALTARFLKEDCKVVVTGRNEEKLKACLSEFNADRLSYLVMDQYDKHQIMAVVAKAFEKQGIDILVNNAGVYTDVDKKRKFRGVTRDEYLAVVEMNLESTVCLSELIARKMAEFHKQGCIISISSICSLEKNYQYTPYGISKAGIDGAVGKFREMFPDICFHVISPGSVATSMGNLGPGSNIARNCNILHRPALPEEIAAFAALLSSPIGHRMETRGGSTYIQSACERL